VSERLRELTSPVNIDGVTALAMVPSYIAAPVGLPRPRERSPSTCSSPPDDIEAHALFASGQAAKPVARAFVDHFVPELRSV
jgi:hypothetical protein